MLACFNAKCLDRFVNENFLKLQPNLAQNVFLSNFLAFLGRVLNYFLFVFYESRQPSFGKSGGRAFGEAVSQKFQMLTIYEKRFFERALAAPMLPRASGALAGMFHLFIHSCIHSFVDLFRNIVGFSFTLITLNLGFLHLDCILK